MTHVFIVNPVSGGGKTEKKYVPLIKAAAEKLGVDYDVHIGSSSADTKDWIRTRASQGDAVRFYAVGGDGTVNDVVSGLIGFDNAELAVIPCGSGNDFVRNWTKKSKDFIESLINGLSSKVDVIKYGDEYSINMINIGADCEVVVQVAALKDKIPGALGYLAAALKILPKGPKYRMIYSVDGGEEIEGEFLLMCIANGKFCGGGFKSCPIASISDGKIDLCLVNAVKGSKVVPLMLKYRQGKHYGNPEFDKIIRYVQCDKFKLTALDPVNVSKDGEVAPFTSAEFEIVPAAVNLVIPDGEEFIFN